MPEFDLDSWLRWMETLNRDRIELGLDRILPVAEGLRLTTFSCPVVVVAGTNGKGSVVASLQSMAMEAGRKVGSYTSPHLWSYTERIQYQGKPISEAIACVYFSKLKASLKPDENLTYFEFGTLAALLYFKDQPLDLLILEVGLGGRLDAVNVVQNDIAVITSIGLDHTEYLGQTREAIGFEKAGVIKYGSQVVCVDPDPPTIIESVAKKQRARLWQLNRDFAYEQQGSEWMWKGTDQTQCALSHPSLPYQSVAGAIMAAMLLPDLKIEKASIIQGIQKAHLPARFQVIPGAVEWIFDVAHNLPAAVWLRDRLRATPCSGSTHVIYGTLAHKDWKSVILSLTGEVDHWYTASIRSSLGAPSNVVADYLISLEQSVWRATDVAEAIFQAKSRARPNDRVVVFGSFYTVSEAMECFCKESGLEVCSAVDKVVNTEALID